MLPIFLEVWGRVGFSDSRVNKYLWDYDYNSTIGILFLLKKGRKMYKKNRKVKVAAISVISNSVLIILKVIAGILSGSVSIISEAIHSGMDLAAAIIAFFSVRLSSKPADENHPYGHGKIENISGVVEGLLIFIAAFLIIKEAVMKIMHPSPINEAFIAIAVMTFSAIVNAFVSRTLYMVAKEEESVALEADALHLKTDVYTSLGVGVGLLSIKLTGITFLDPVVAILVALLIIKEAWHLCKNAFSPLLDSRLSEEEEGKIREVIAKYKESIVDYHKLRTRKVGNIKYIDFHLLVDKDLTVYESHQLSEELEKALELTLQNTNVNIHIEPV